MTHDGLMTGFPPAPESQVTLACPLDTLRACGALAAHLAAAGR